MKGSVGASGDLAPLGHMALSLIGEGKVFLKGKKMSTGVALKKLKIKPLELEPKEGISLINGTQVSTAFSIKAGFIPSANIATPSPVYVPNTRLV